MAYRIKFSKSFNKEVHRLLAAQIARAVAELSGETTSASVIHETRKSLKRSRSILRLVRPALTKRGFVREDHALRAIARVLSQRRDREVMRETLAHLMAATRTPAEREALHAVAPMFAEEPESPAVHDNPESDARLALSMLQEADRSLRKLKMSRVRIDTLAEGMAGTYTDARRNLKAARRSGKDTCFHDLRKNVQHHWRHLQLLSPVWPDVMEARISAARQLAQLLGDDHDLSVLANHMTENRPDGASPEHRAAVAAIARAAQVDLRDEAIPLAQHLFAQRPRDLKRFIIDQWPAAMRIAAGEKRRKAKAAPKHDAGIVAFTARA